MRLVALGALGSLFVAAIAACEDASTIRAPFEPRADASSPPEASIPEAGMFVPDEASTRPPFDASTPPIACAVTPCAHHITAGENHFCALVDDGGLRCWGDPAVLAIDAGAREDAAPPGSIPTSPSGIADVVDVSANGYATCALRSDGGVDCWDYAVPEPTHVPDLGPAEKVYVGEDSETRCAKTKTGELTCWGYDMGLGGGVRTIDTGGEKAGAVAMAYGAGFLFTAKGTVFSWGSDPTLLGRSSSVTDLAPAPVDAIPAVVELATGYDYACAVAADGRLFCWGHGAFGQLGRGAFRDELVPAEVLLPGPAWPRKLAAGLAHTCLARTDGAVYCFSGTNAYGQLGIPQSDGVYVPTRVDAIDPVKTPIVELAASAYSTCALAIDGSVQCWGQNNFGQLGRGTRDDDRHPEPARVIFK